MNHNNKGSNSELQLHYSINWGMCIYKYKGSRLGFRYLFYCWTDILGIQENVHVLSCFHTNPISTGTVRSKSQELFGILQNDSHTITPTVC